MLFAPQFDQLGLHPELGHVAQIYAVLLPLVRSAQVSIPSYPRGEQDICAQLAAGVPLARGFSIPPERESAPRLMLAFARALESDEHGTLEKREEAARICLALEERALNPDTLLSHAATGDRGFVLALGRNQGLDGHLLWLVTECARKPSLRALERQLGKHLADCLWTRAVCPLCGSFALCAEQRGEETDHHMRCGTCGADWSGRGLCLYSGDRTSRSVRINGTEGEGPETHAQLCDHCQGYLKVIRTDGPSDPDFLMLHDLATFPLDRLAMSQGYSRLPGRA